MWNAKKGCNVVTSEKAKGTCRFQGSTRLAAIAILGLTVITNGVNTASAEGRLLQLAQLKLIPQIILHLSAVIYIQAQI